MEFEKKVLELDVNDVLPNRFQPRIKFNEDSINELCESIKEHGVIQPIVVRAMGDKYEIIAGERRYKASLLAGKQTIPAVITELNDKDSAEVALIENVQRKDLTPIEEAISYKKILDMGYLTQEELAVKLGKTQSTVANKLRLLNLDEEVQEAVLEEKISERHARSLLKLSDMNMQRNMLKKIIDNRLTVRKTDEEINKMLNGHTEDNGVSKIEEVITNSEIIDTVVDEDENPFKVNVLPTNNIATIDTSNVVSDTSIMDSPIVIIDDPEELPIANEDEVAVTPVEEFNPFKMEEQAIPASDNNIPSLPIEDAPAPQPTEYNDSVINPGFMNIEKIETSAEDINKEEKAPIDINSLLKPSIVGEETQVAPVEEEPKEEPIQTGKFFSLPVGDNKNENESNNTQIKEEGIDLNSPTGTAPSFNFDMNIIPTEPVPVVNEPTEPVDLNSLTSPTPEEHVNNLLEPITPAAVEPVPVLSPIDIAGTESNQGVIESQPVKTDEVFSLDDISPSTDLISPSSVEALSMPTESTVNEPVILETQTPENTIDSAPVETLTTDTNINQISKEDLSNNLINPNFDFNIAAPVERETLNAGPVISSEDMPVPTLASSAVVANKNVNAALEQVRGAIAQLEKNGYIIDTEEFDFETAYQIVIKIQK